MEYERKNDHCKYETVFGRKLQRENVEVEELEDLLGSDDIDLDFRRILEEARDEKWCAKFDTLHTDGSE